MGKRFEQIKSVMSIPVQRDFKDIFLPNPFWDFSVKFYGKPKVEDSCLYLQNHQFMNVNILLFTCWFVLEKGNPLKRFHYAQLQQAIGRWHTTITEPLRQIRQSIQSSGGVWEKIRQDIYQEELASEYVEQWILKNKMPSLPFNFLTTEGKVECLWKSMKSYSEFLNQNLSLTDIFCVQQIIHALFPEIAMHRIEKMCI